MGNKKKKYNARFPPARIKKIMQMDEEVGKIAAAVPVVISRALELFLEQLIKQSVDKAAEKSAKTLTSSHIKSVIHSIASFDFLKTQVTAVPDLEVSDCILSAEGHSGVSRQVSVAAADTNGSPMPASRKRSKTSPASTATGASGEPEDKVKRKRGRPPKVKLPDMENPQSTQDFATPSSQTLTDTSTSAATPAAYDLTTGEHQAVPPSYTSSLPMVTTPPSIFSMDSTVLSQSQMSHKSPAAHSGPYQHPVSQHMPTTSSEGLIKMYANLSPTSQPIDLSTKAFIGSDNSAFKATSSFVYKDNQIGRHNLSNDNGAQYSYANRQRGIQFQSNEDDDDDYDT